MCYQLSYPYDNAFLKFAELLNKILQQYIWIEGQKGFPDFLHYLALIFKYEDLWVDGQMLLA